jgi:YspA, cpYpsA-related SLOG family
MNITTGRLLITGSRQWFEWCLIYHVLDYARRSGFHTLVSGHCPDGADFMCESTWEYLGLVVERHPADWKTHGKSAGYRRNAEMVQLGADWCLACILNESKGSTHTAKLAEEAGIPTTRITMSVPSWILDGILAPQRTYSGL